jgi:hypothetical protein
MDAACFVDSFLAESANKPGQPNSSRRLKEESGIGSSSNDQYDLASRMESGVISIGGSRRGDSTSTLSFGSLSHPHGRKNGIQIKPENTTFSRPAFHTIGIQQPRTRISISKDQSRSS